MYKEKSISSNNKCINANRNDIQIETGKSLSDGEPEYSPSYYNRPILWDIRTNIGKHISIKSKDDSITSPSSSTMPKPKFYDDYAIAKNKDLFDTNAALAVAGYVSTKCNKPKTFRQDVTLTFEVVKSLPFSNTACDRQHLKSDILWDQKINYDENYNRKQELDITTKHRPKLCVSTIMSPTNSIKKSSDGTAPIVHSPSTKKNFNATAVSLKQTHIPKKMITKSIDLIQEIIKEIRYQEIQRYKTNRAAEMKAEKIYNDIVNVQRLFREEISNKNGLCKCQLVKTYVPPVPIESNLPMDTVDKISTDERIYLRKAMKKFNYPLYRWIIGGIISILIAIPLSCKIILNNQISKVQHNPIWQSNATQYLAQFSTDVTSSMTELSRFIEDISLKLEEIKSTGINTDNKILLLQMQIYNELSEAKKSVSQVQTATDALIHRLHTKSETIIASNERFNGCNNSSLSFPNPDNSIVYHYDKAMNMYSSYFGLAFWRDIIGIDDASLIVNHSFQNTQDVKKSALILSDFRNVIGLDMQNYYKNIPVTKQEEVIQKNLISKLIIVCSSIKDLLYPFILSHILRVTDYIMNASMEKYIFIILMIGLISCCLLYGHIIQKFLFGFKKNIMKSSSESVETEHVTFFHNEIQNSKLKISHSKEKAIMLSPKENKLNEFKRTLEVSNTNVKFEESYLSHIMSIKQENNLKSRDRCYSEETRAINQLASPFARRSNSVGSHESVPLSTNKKSTSTKTINKFDMDREESFDLFLLFQEEQQFKELNKMKEDNKQEESISFLPVFIDKSKNTGLASQVENEISRNAHDADERDNHEANIEEADNLSELIESINKMDLSSASTLNATCDINVVKNNSSPIEYAVNEKGWVHNNSPLSGCSSLSSHAWEYSHDDGGSPCEHILEDVDDEQLCSFSHSPISNLHDDCVNDRTLSILQLRNRENYRRSGRSYSENMELKSKTKILPNILYVQKDRCQSE